MMTECPECGYTPDDDDEHPNPNTRYTPDGNIEPEFREQVREALDLDWGTRDQQILDEIRRLKRVEARVLEGAAAR